VIVAGDDVLSGGRNGAGNDLIVVRVAGNRAKRRLWIDYGRQHDQGGSVFVGVAARITIPPLGTHATQQNTNRLVDDCD
jgi:hypothetical protein